MLQGGTNPSVFTNLWTTNGLYAVLFGGHGNGKGMYGFTNQGLGIYPYQVNPPYKLGTIWGLFCFSADKMVITRIVQGWQGHVSNEGGFLGYPDIQYNDTPDYKINDPYYIP